MISLLLLTPLAGMLVSLFLPAKWSKYWAAAVSAATAALSIQLLRTGAAAERVPWIPTLGVDYHVAADGISQLMLVLTAVMTLLAILASFESITERTKEFYSLLLLLESAMLGVFVAQDLVLFFVFFEFSLVPMYFLIGLWGGARRLYAAIKFFLYTLSGSVFLLLGIIVLYLKGGAKTFDAATLLAVPLDEVTAQWVFWAFFLAFAIKVPMFPLHTWLPDAHTEAPTAGSVILAGVMLKMGTYGFLRFSLPLLPKSGHAREIVTAMAVLSIIAILYGALVSLMQKDWKRLVAYSSVSHLGFCTLGLFSLNASGISGSVLQQVNHGISTGLLFLIVGLVYERRHTRVIADFGGLAHAMPNLAVIFAIAMLSSAGLPLLNGFVGEFAILNGAYQANALWAYWSVPGVVLGAAYLLWLYQRTMLGPQQEINRGLPDLSVREWLTVLPLVAWAISIGVYPKPYFDLIAPGVKAALEALHRS
ncbi:MAG: NADH-quinone oxidoreductase subunit M [Acidobacteria bacterium]|nr:NADH-quinone oxidoreductase subunit M [Acidobacteriota bacterium]